MSVVFFDDNAFEAGETHAMGIAFHSACHALGIAGRTNPQTQTIARRIVALAQHGVTDPIRLCHGALAGMDRRVSPRRSPAAAWRNVRRLPVRRAAN